MKEPDKESMAMGKRIQQSRKVAKLIQMSFAEKLDVSTQYISDLERGVVGCSVATLIKICEILKVSSDFILWGYKPDLNNPSCFPDNFFNLSMREQELIKEGIDIMIKLSDSSK